MRARAPLIVCIDDEASILRVVALTLGAEFSVETAASAEHALRVVDEHDDDLWMILTDLRLPDLDGVSLLERFAATHPAARLLLMSGHATPADTTAAIAAGAEHVLFKPFSGAALRAAVGSPDGDGPSARAPGGAAVLAVARAARALGRRTDSALDRAVRATRVVASVLGHEASDEVLAEAVDGTLLPNLAVHDPVAGEVRDAAGHIVDSSDGGDDAVAGFADDPACGPQARAAIVRWLERDRRPRAVVARCLDLVAPATLASHMITSGGALLAVRGTVLDASRLERMRRSPLAAPAPVVVYPAT